MQIALNSFVKRQTPNSRFSHTSLSWEELLELIQQHIALAQPGYREGILEVDLPLVHPINRQPIFFCPVVELEPGQPLIGKYESRIANEEPRQWMGTAIGEKMPAKFCKAILYTSDLLKETEQNDHEDGLELVTLIASIVEDEPMTPTTLMENHFGGDGGTATNLSDAMFVKKLCHSWKHWKNKALFVPPSDGLYIVQAEFDPKFDDHETLFSEKMLCSSVHEARAQANRFCLYVLSTKLEQIPPEDFHCGLGRADFLDKWELYEYLETQYADEQYGWESSLELFERLDELTTTLQLAYVQIEQIQTDKKHWTCWEL
jgi:hypothetical protein